MPLKNIASEIDKEIRIGIIKITNILLLNMFYKINSNKIITTQNIYIFSIIFIFTLLIFSLGNYFNFFSINHGPYYYLIAENLYENFQLSPNYHTFYDKSDLYTFQIGIVLFDLIGIILFGKENFFISLYLFHSIFWLLAFNAGKSYLSEKLIDKKLIYIIFLLIYLQPYNILSIANFINEAIYIPCMIFMIFKTIKLLEINDLKKFFQYNSILENYLYVLIIIFGIFFRFHHLIVLTSFIFSMFFIKNLNKNIIFFTLTLAIIKILLISIIFILDIGSINELLIYHLLIPLKNFTFFNNFFYDISIEEITIGKSIFIEDYFVWERLFGPFNIFSSPLVLNKLIGSSYLLFIINLALMLFFLCGLINLNISKVFLCFSYIFIFISFIFILILPMNENNYFLPSSIILIICNIIFLKKILGNFFFKVIYFFSIVLSCILIILYTGIIKSNLVETYEQRNLMDDLDILSNLSIFDDENIIFKTDRLSIPELISWKLKIKFCNKTIEDCISDKSSVVVFVDRINQEDSNNDEYLEKFIKIKLQNINDVHEVSGLKVLKVRYALL